MLNAHPSSVAPAAARQPERRWLRSALTASIAVLAAGCIAVAGGGGGSVRSVTLGEARSELQALALRSARVEAVAAAAASAHHVHGVMQDLAELRRHPNVAAQLDAIVKDTDRAAGRASAAEMPESPAAMQTLAALAPWASSKQQRAALVSEIKREAAKVGVNLDTGAVAATAAAADVLGARAAAQEQTSQLAGAYVVDRAATKAQLRAVIKRQQHLLASIDLAPSQLASDSTDQGEKDTGRGENRPVREHYDNVFASQGRAKKTSDTFWDPDAFTAQANEEKKGDASARQWHMFAPSSSLAKLQHEKQADSHWQGEENVLNALEAKAESRLKKDKLAAEDESPSRMKVRGNVTLEADDSGELVPSDSIAAVASAMGYRSVKDFFTAEKKEAGAARLAAEKDALKLEEARKKAREQDAEKLRAMEQAKAAEEREKEQKLLAARAQRERKRLAAIARERQVREEEEAKDERQLEAAAAAERRDRRDAARVKKVLMSERREDGGSGGAADDASIVRHPSKGLGSVQNGRAGADSATRKLHGSAKLNWYDVSQERARKDEERLARRERREAVELSRERQAARGNVLGSLASKMRKIWDHGLSFTKDSKAGEELQEAVARQKTQEATELEAWRKFHLQQEQLKALQQQELRASEDGKVRHHEVLFGGLPADEMRRKMAASRSSLAATAARQARGAVPFPRAEDALQSTLKRLAASHGEHAAMAVASGVARAFSS